MSAAAVVVTASPRDIARIRVTRQGLGSASPDVLGSDRPLSTAADVVERMLAIQAQDLPAAAWALGVRAPGLTQADVDQAINEGSILRSWPMRGTLHFVPPADLNWMLELTTPRLMTGTKTRRTQLDLDMAVIEQAREIAQEALVGGRALTRAAFLELLEAHGIATANQRGYHLIWHLAQSGTLCWGPRVANVQALVLLDEWVPNPRRLVRDEALGEFVLRYFAGHGPATLKDFAWWAKLTVADATLGLAVVRDRLIEIRVGETSHFLPADADTGSWGSIARQRSPVLALAGFDEMLLGYTDRSFAVSVENFERVVPGKNGMFLPMMLEHGRVLGTWRREKTSRGITAEPRPFDGLTARQRASFERSIREYSTFLGVPVGVIPSS
ncbi:winged helix DNA-binding domain-containing protein [Leifsonia kafniensis]|uniref:Winged helix DNA-binding domain-containing protein n=1 Tax=Leifsonia kafniensis TaxID=475957 RepID=A0ABP7K560_9MICO